MTQDKHRETARTIKIGICACGGDYICTQHEAIATALATTEADAYARGRGEAAETARRELAQQGQDLGLGSAKTAQLQGSVVHAILASSPGPSLEERVRAEIAEKVGALRQVRFGEFDGPWLDRDDVLAAIKQESEK